MSETSESDTTTHRSRRELLAGIAASGLAATAGCLGFLGPNISDTNLIKIKSGGFEPINTEFERGTPLIFENRTSETVHIVSASDNWELDVNLQGGKAVRKDIGSSGVYVAELTGDSKAANSNKTRLKVGINTDIESPVKPSG